MTQHTGFYRFYNAGHGQRISEDLYIFTCSLEADGPGGCHSVYASKVQENIAALERLGYVGPISRPEIVAEPAP